MIVSQCSRHILKVFLVSSLLWELLSVKTRVERQRKRTTESYICGCKEMLQGDEEIAYPGATSQRYHDRILMKPKQA
jgi:hypothetical protein